MELRLVADTNLFFECKPLKQLPWGELRHDPVVILLTKPVLDEIDKHKRGTGRTRARALDVFGLVRTMLTRHEREVELRSASPRVVVRLEGARPDPSLRDDLDYGKVDERLVGIVSTLRTAAPEHLVRLFTDDTGPASTASGLGLPFQMIEGGWRRPPSESTEGKRIKELERDLATYRAQEPRISISACEGAGTSNVVRVTRLVARALTSGDVEEVLASLRAKHPLKQKFVPPPPKSVTGQGGEVMRTEYLPPPDEAVIEYREVLHPQWIERCRAILTRLHEGRDVREPSLVVRWSMSNVGTRPASQVRVEFAAKGPLMLARLSKQESCADVPDAAPSPPPLPSFPRPPQAPPFRERVTRTPPPAQPKTASGHLLDPSISASAFLRRDHDLFARPVGDVLGAAVPFSHRLGASALVADASRMFPGASVLDPRLGSAFAAMATPERFDIPAVVRPFIPPRHDPERFYWDLPAEGTVKVGALTCDLWRHQVEGQTFEFEVVFDHDGEARGSVECTVHAENLTTPEQARCVVRRIVDFFDVRDLAEAMVASCM